MSEKGTTVTLGIYVDGASEPIAKTVLNRQKKKMIEKPKEYFNRYFKFELNR